MTPSPAKSVIRTLFLVIVAVAVQGCRGQGSPTTPLEPSSPIVPPNWVQFATLSPSAGTYLEPGATVTFNVTVQYGLTTQDTGRIVVVLQDMLSYQLQQPGEQTVVSVSRGRGEASFSTTLHVPERSVSLSVVLIPDDEHRTTAYDKAVFPVSSNKAN